MGWSRNFRINLCKIEGNWLVAERFTETLKARIYKKNEN